MNPFKSADFEPHLSSVFEVLIPEQAPVPIKLSEIQVHASGAAEGFSLMFTGSPERIFRHNTYSLKHPVLGELPIFLGPVHFGSTDPSVVHYQAVFSTLKSEQV